MVSAGTLHVVSTELAVGAFAMAGVAFLLAGLASHGWLNMGRHLSLVDHVAHFALAFCQRIAESQASFLRPVAVRLKI